jgi:hypothetical protein
VEPPTSLAIAQRARQMLSKITEPCEENVVKHHAADRIFAEQNDDLAQIESDEPLIDRKLLDLMPEGGSYEVVELRTKLSPTGNHHVHPTIGYSRIEYGACRMLNKKIPQDLLLAFLDEREPDHGFMVLPYGAFRKALISEEDGPKYRAIAEALHKADPNEANARTLGFIARRVPAHGDEVSLPSFGGPA